MLEFQAALQCGYLKTFRKILPVSVPDSTCILSDLGIIPFFASDSTVVEWGC